MLALVACGGGGDGGSSTSGADRFRNQDFRNSTGLDQIRAAEGYAQVTGPQGGEGTIIAIVDDGIDESHPDIAPNLIASFVFNDSADVAGAHGTAVAAIAAGATGNGGTQGVAFNAGILSYQAGDANPDDPTTILFDDEFIAAAVVDAATVEGADIINMSLGTSLRGPILLNTGETIFLNFDDAGNASFDDVFIPNSGDALIQDSIETAVGAGKLVVIAAGNDNGAGLAAFEEALDLPAGTFVDIGAASPAIPAADPTQASSAGVIVAVAVDDNNNLADFSNSCLGVADRCLAAPGVDFQGAQPGGGTGNIGSGTSYSAPMISGAAAVVQAAFGVTPQEAGNRLLDTATDLGAAGTDDVFGRGLLNLENALSPQGQLTVALGTSSDGPKVPLSNSSLSLGSSLALDGAGSDLFGDAISLDDDNFPFGVDLGRSAAVQSRTTGLEAFIGSSDRNTAAVDVENGFYTLSLAQDAELDDPYRADFAASDTSLKAEADLPRMLMQSEVQEGVEVFASFNGSSNTDAGLVQSLPEAGDFFQPTAFLAPFDQLSGDQTGGGTKVDIADDTALTVSAFTSTDDEATRQTTMQKVELAHKTVGDIELRVGYGFMQEDGGFLGSEVSGVFGADSGGNSQYLDLSVLAPVTEKVSLFGAYSRGNTDASGGGNSILSGYTTIQSEAFGAGLVVADFAEKGDGFSMMVGQPLRVTDGSAEVTLPTARNQDGSVVQESATLDLAPDGREIAVEAVYHFALDDDDHALTAGSFVRFNPDHDTEADPDVGVGVTYKLTF